MTRLTTTQLDEALGALDDIVTELDHVEITDQVVRSAGALARSHGLRGYDAVTSAPGCPSPTKTSCSSRATRTWPQPQALGIAVANTNERPRPVPED